MGVREVVSVYRGHINTDSPPLSCFDGRTEAEGTRVQEWTRGIEERETTPYFSQHQHSNAKPLLPPYNPYSAFSFFPYFFPPIFSYFAPYVTGIERRETRPHPSIFLPATMCSVVVYLRRYPRTTYTTGLFIGICPSTIPRRTYSDTNAWVRRVTQYKILSR